MSGTVNNPATFGTVRTAFGNGFYDNLSPPTNMGAYIRGTEYVPLGPSYDSISDAANGLRLSQFNGKAYPPVAAGTGTATANVILVGELTYSTKFGTGTQRGYYRGSFGAITTEQVVFGTVTGKFGAQYDIFQTLRYMYFDFSSLMFAFDGNVTGLGGSFRIGRHSFSFSGGGTYYNGGVGNRYTYWQVSLPSNPFNGTGTLAELKLN
jgi:hypothetical protein